MGAASAGGCGSNVGAGRGLHHRRDVLVRLLAVGFSSGFGVRLFRGVTLLGWFRKRSRDRVSREHLPRLLLR